MSSNYDKRLTKASAWQQDGHLHIPNDIERRPQGRPTPDSVITPAPRAKRRTDIKPIWDLK